MSESTTTEKACTKCGEVKPLEDFHANKQGKHGRAPRCRACTATANAERDERLGKIEYDPNLTKECTRCGQVKALADFYRKNDSILGRASECKTCFREAQNKVKNADPLWAAYTNKKNSVSAKRHGFTLTIERVRELWAETGAKCAYLGIPLLFRDYGARNGNRDEALSFDRIDSTRGYSDDNVQLISNFANKMKSNANDAELVTFAKSILRIHGE